MKLLLFLLSLQWAAAALICWLALVVTVVAVLVTLGLVSFALKRTLS